MVQVFVYGINTSLSIHPVMLVKNTNPGGAKTKFPGMGCKTRTVVGAHLPMEAAVASSPGASSQWASQTYKTW